MTDQGMRAFTNQEEYQWGVLVGLARNVGWTPSVACEHDKPLPWRVRFTTTKGDAFCAAVESTHLPDALDAACRLLVSTLATQLREKSVSGAARSNGQVYHSRECGTVYRGCAPDCPKDLAERAAEILRVGQCPETAPDGGAQCTRPLGHAGRHHCGAGVTEYVWGNP